MGRDDGPDNREPETRALGVAASISAGERLEQGGGRAGGQPGPAVGHRQPHGGPARAERDVDRAAGRAKLAGIGEQIQQDLVEPPAIGQHREPPRAGREPERLRLLL